MKKNEKRKYYICDCEPIKNLTLENIKLVEFKKP